MHILNMLVTSATSIAKGYPGALSCSQDKSSIFHPIVYNRNWQSSKQIRASCKQTQDVTISTAVWKTRCTGVQHMLFWQEARLYLHCVSMTSHNANEFSYGLLFCGLWFALTYSCGFIRCNCSHKANEKIHWHNAIMETQCYSWGH